MWYQDYIVISGTSKDNYLFQCCTFNSIQQYKCYYLQRSAAIPMYCCKIWSFFYLHYQEHSAIQSHCDWSQKTLGEESYTRTFTNTHSATKELVAILFLSLFLISFQWLFCNFFMSAFNFSTSCSTSVIFLINSTLSTSICEQVLLTVLWNWSNRDIQFQLLYIAVLTEQNRDEAEQTRNQKRQIYKYLSSNISCLRRCRRA
jgi:hypothetical protein